ncbi:hypothetical protein CASFOL_027326 [Castilleja foliolosa]|uniref:Uncharacterized protein n=1 Tax=Castilleja foliolosa TaxID=1961234 RepID=A0ABD3CEH6_9LAMI
MGNCVILQEKPLNEMKRDENVTIDYKSQISVHQKLPIFSHHQASNKHVHPKSTVGFSDDVVEDERRASGVVRVKLVISKQELQAMLEDGLSVQNKVQTQLKLLNTNKFAGISRDYCNMSNKGWLPVLESIPEVN